MVPTVVTAQQAAIQNVRMRYERGDLSFEAFRRALDALVLARNAEECQAILDALPNSPLAPLAALERADVTTAVASPTPRRKWIVAFMGETKKIRRPWRLSGHTRALALMGEVKLDLNIADLPPRAAIQIAAIMGSVTLYVPRDTQVTVRSTIVLGESNALGESTSGVIGFGHEEHTPTPGRFARQLDVEVFAMMAEVKVALTDGPVYSISEMVRDAFQLAAEGVRRGLREGAAPPALGPGSQG